MLRRLDDFYKTYATLTEGTLKILEQLTDENLNQKVGPDHRTLGGMAWHIVTTVPEMMSQTGLGMSSVNHEAPLPDTAAAIVDGYRKVSTELVEALQGTWKDETLEEVDDLYGEKWPRGVTLLVLVHHEIHHRGQMTVLLRQAGTQVPGIYGPSREEWKKFGMETPPY